MNKTCDICGGSIKDCVHYDYDRNGNQTGKITCQKCYMTKYRYGSYEKPSKVNKTKIYVSFDGKNFSWIVVNNGKLISSPTKEDLKDAKNKFYNKTNICPICMKYNNLTNKSILYPGNACHNVDKNGNQTNEWVCLMHHNNNYNRNNPNSYNNIKKSLSQRRTKNLYSPHIILAENCEMMTETMFGAKRLSVEFDNFELPLDHFPISQGVSIVIAEKIVDLSGKIPQTKGRTCLSIADQWNAHVESEFDKEFDILIYYCISRDGTFIERIYIIPKDDIDISAICVTKNPTDSYGNSIIGKYEKYRVTDNEFMNKSNKIWQEIKNIQQYQ